MRKLGQSSDSKFRFVIQEVVQFIKNKIWHINSGGCGTFCDYVSAELKARNIEHQIFSIRGNYVDGEEVIMHVALQVDDIYFDGARIHTSLFEFMNDFKSCCPAKAFYVEVMTDQEFRHLMDTADWKKDYDTSQNVKLQKGIKQKFELWDKGELQQNSEFDVQTLSWQTRLKQGLSFLQKTGKIVRKGRSPLQ